MSDLALLQRWADRRDAKAFKEITKLYAPMVFATCKRILGNATDAEDVAQECFEVLARGHKKPDKHLGAWLHRVATNRALDRMRSEQRRKAREASYVAERPSNVDVEWGDIYEYVDEAIADLPEQLRELVVAHYLQDKSHSEIAKELDVSYKTVSRWTAKGVDLIGKSLKKRGISIGAGVLASVMAANFAQAASVPSSLSVALGKLSLAHSVNPAASGTLSISGAAKALGATLFANKAMVVTAIAITAALALWPDRKGDVADLAEQSQNENSPSTVVSEVSIETSTQFIISADSDRQPSVTLSAARFNGTRNTLRISGQVVDDVTNAPVTNYQIGYAVNWPADFSIAVAAARRTMVYVKDAGGRFKIDCPRSSTISIVVKAQGFAFGHKVLHGVPGNASLDNVLIRLGPGASVRGIIVNDRGRALRGVGIFTSQGIGKEIHSGIAQSAEDGSFQVDSFPIDISQIFARGESGSRRQGSADLNLEPGGIFQTRIVLPRGVELSGYVHKDDKPASGIRVSAFDTLSERGGGRLSTLTGKDGHYTLRNILPGPLLIEARATFDSEQQYDRQSDSSTPVERVIVKQIEIDSPGDELLDFDFESRSWLEGNVTVNGEPAQAKLDIFVEMWDGGTEQFVARADKTGYYHLENIPPGLATFKVSAGGRPPWTSTSSLSPAVVNVHNVEIEQGGTIAFQVDRHILRGYRLSMRICSGTLEPDAFALRDPVKRWRLDRLSIAAEAGIGIKKETLIIRDVQPGTYTIHASLHDASADSEKEILRSFREGVATFDVAEGMRSYVTIRNTNSPTRFFDIRQVKY